MRPPAYASSACPMQCVVARAMRPLPNPTAATSMRHDHRHQYLNFRFFSKALTGIPSERKMSPERQPTGRGDHQIIT
jgi:hypothetical protein